jgi:beta-lactamase superfamily II metal-dependent hydrolase
MERWLRYTVLPVGQGAGVFVQVWEGQERFKEDNARPIEAALIDLGSLGWKKTAGTQSALFVANQLTKMTAPRLDAVFLSHSDSDHTNLLKDLFEYFAPPRTSPPSKPILSVGKAWFGGNADDYKKRSIDPLPLLVRYGAALEDIGAGESSWKFQPLRPLHQSEKGVVYNLLVGNTLNPGPDIEDEEEDNPERWRAASESFKRNVVSLVLVVQYGQQPIRLVATGDSTGLTLAECNKLIKAKQISIAPVLTLSLPHHGSETSTFDMNGYSRSGSDDATAAKVVAEFAANLRPESITASAAERSTYRHPSSRVIAAFAGPTGRAMYREGGLGDQHFFTAHYQQDGLPLNDLNPGDDDMVVDRWPSGEGWYTGRTNRNVFTIDYTREDPREKDLAAISYATPQNPQAQSTASLGGPRLSAADALPPQAAGWGYYVSSDGTKGTLERLVDVGNVRPQVRAALEAVHGPLPPEGFVFIPSAPEPGPAAEPPPRPAVVPEVPRRRARSDLPRRPRQLL